MSPSSRAGRERTHTKAASHSPGRQRKQTFIRWSLNKVRCAALFFTDDPAGCDGDIRPYQDNKRPTTTVTDGKLHSVSAYIP